MVNLVEIKRHYKMNYNIYTVYTNYHKVHDSVPHSWLLEVLNIYKISPKIVNFLKQIIPSWQVTLKSQVNNKSNIINPI